MIQCNNKTNKTKLNRILTEKRKLMHSYMHSYIQVFVNFSSGFGSLAHCFQATTSQKQMKNCMTYKREPKKKSKKNCQM